MLDLKIPGYGQVKIKYIVFDVNGTLARDGEISESIIDKVSKLQLRHKVHLITADTHGKQLQIDKKLGLTATRIKAGNEAIQKAEYIEKLGADSVLAIGNGANDVEMLKEAGLGICVIGPEGASIKALNAADIVTTSIETAIDLILYPKRLVATVRQ